MDKAPKFETPEELILEAYISSLTHIGKNYLDLETAIENMPIEFWSKLGSKERDEVEKRLKKYFREEA